jgi:hypothetical protein
VTRLPIRVAKAETYASRSACAEEISGNNHEKLARLDDTGRSGGAAETGAWRMDQEAELTESYQ